MTHRATLVLSLCFALLTPFAAQAQEAAPEPVETAPASGDAAPVTAEADPVAAEAVPAEQDPPPPVAPPPVPEDTAPVEESVQTQAAADNGASVSAAVPAADAGANDDKNASAKAQRCAQLMAQGQTALAQAENCGGGDTPFFAGSIISISQVVAPAAGTLPDADNRFAALNLYMAPRIRITQKWGLVADMSLAYEQTEPDFAAQRHKVEATDPRLTLIGNLGSFGGFTFAGGPRLVLPLTAPSRNADAYVGAGGALNIVRAVKVLEGLAFVAGGAYNHTFAGNVTRENDDSKNVCNDVQANTVSCPVGNLAIVQDSFRAVGVASLNVTKHVGLQAAYVYGWNFAKKLSDVPLDNLPPNNGTTDFVGEQGGSRWRRLGIFSLAVNYQPTDWVIAAVQGSTAVCYDLPSGAQAALGGCAGGLKNNDFWERNPIANKFSTVSLVFTIPIDAVYMRIKNRTGEEKQTAAAQSSALRL